MIVKAPVNSLNAAKLQCRFGAKEIYVGLQDDNLNKISFSGRGTVRVDSNNSFSNLKTIEELVEIVDYCHSENVKVAFAANCPSLTDNMKVLYRNYILRVLETGIDSIIVGDISSLLVVKEIVPPNIKVCASVFLKPIMLAAYKC